MPASTRRSIFEISKKKNGRGFEANTSEQLQAIKPPAIQLDCASYVSARRGKERALNSHTVRTEALQHGVSKSTRRVALPTAELSGEAVRFAAVREVR